MKRAALKAALLVGITVTLWAMAATFAAADEVVEWSNLVSELLVCLLIASWIFLLSPASAARQTYLILLWGLFVTYTGAFQDLLDELYLLGPLDDIIEDLCYPAGLMVFTVGLVKWVYEHRQTYKRLRSQKRELEQLTVTDELTGLYNARHFTRTLEREIERSERYGRKLSILFIDLDNFKRFNDSYGHVEGNRVLQACARIITNALRESDSSYRFGGEEFTVILPETDSNEAFAVAERIRESFAAYKIEPEGHPPLHMTLSGGLAELTESDTLTSLVERADSAMYEAKMRGKDRIVVWEPSEPEE